MTDKEKFDLWLRNVTDEQLLSELRGLQSDEKQIEDRFYCDLGFGTGGLRGKIGAGTNRMNIHTVERASQGLSDYIVQENKAHAGAHAPAHKKPSIAIAYDSRKNSRLFAHAAACVFAANGIKVHVFNRLMPTPMLSFAVRELQCDAGIVITASHNPAVYNGYKVYGDDGCQITLEAAQRITAHIERTDGFADVKTMDFDQAVGEGKIRYIGRDVENRYFEEVLKCSVYGGAAHAGLKVVYTPLSGAGNLPVRRILADIYVTDVTVVKEQELPDENFTTCPSPNPEIQEALALGLTYSEKVGADLLLGTDPDCDRVGCAVRHKGKYVRINGNQMGVLLLDFICNMRKAEGTMPENPLAIKTIVTSEMAQAVAGKHGVELLNVLTGFKFIGEQIGLLEQAGEQARFIFGFEESYGYLPGAYVRDKDAVSACMLICEMAAYYKNHKQTLVDALMALQKSCGYYSDQLQSFVFEGAEGMRDMEGIMGALRAQPPVEIAGLKVTAVDDYLRGVRTSAGGQQKLDLPSSDVMGFALFGGSSIVVRPSGTEPLLKIYYSMKSNSQAQSDALYEKAQKDITKLIGQHKKA